MGALANKRKPCFDVWVCQGRLCTAHRSDGLFEVLTEAAQELPQEDQERLRVLRGGCFGLCDMAANIVVRRWASPGRRPDPGVDRLTITARKNETVYSKMEPDTALVVLHTHLDDDEPAHELTLEARQDEIPPNSKTARNIRALRARWGEDD